MRREHKHAASQSGNSTIGRKRYDAMLITGKSIGRSSRRSNNSRRRRAVEGERLHTGIDCEGASSVDRRNSRKDIKTRVERERDISPTSNCSVVSIHEYIRANLKLGVRTTAIKLTCTGPAARYMRDIVPGGT